jgi:ubiquinol-cytochrome c reductase cytochrome b subunit
MVIHLISLHEHGSNNPLGTTANVDRIPFSPYYIFKDGVGYFVFLLIASIFIFYAPNYLGHPDNYIPANPLVTPVSIVPEWYFLPFYAILRSIPDKLGGVIAMFGAILITLILPIVDRSKIRSNAFKPISRFFFWLFIANFFLLGWIGGNHAEEPFITIGQICTIFYFSYFLIIIPVLSKVENKEHKFFFFFIL